MLLDLRRRIRAIDDFCGVILGGCDQRLGSSIDIGNTATFGLVITRLRDSLGSIAGSRPLPLAIGLVTSHCAGSWEPRAPQQALSTDWTKLQDEIFRQQLFSTFFFFFFRAGDIGRIAGGAFTARAGKSSMQQPHFAKQGLCFPVAAAMIIPVRCFSCGKVSYVPGEMDPLLTVVPGRR